MLRVCRPLTMHNDARSESDEGQETTHVIEGSLRPAALGLPVQRASGRLQAA
jgi:hypothetical protein